MKLLSLVEASRGLLEQVARLAHDLLLDLLPRQPRGGAVGEDRHRQDLAAVVIRVAELGIGALRLPEG